MSAQPGSLPRALLRSRSFVAGSLLTAMIAGMAALSLVWTPHDVTLIDVPGRLQGPGGGHLLGTDHLGRDLLSMLMVGAQTSIAVAFLSVLVGAAIGVPLGLYAAARGGWFDEMLMRANDLVFAFPALLTAAMLTALFGASATNAVIAIGVFNIPVFARVARGGALVVLARDFILAARACGKGTVRILAEHVAPNVASLLVVQATILFALGILAEAGLSYVGLGTQPPWPSWGRMLNEAQTMMGFAPQLALVPGLAIVVTVLGLNLLGDGLRDALDPRLKEGH